MKKQSFLLLACFFSVFCLCGCEDKEGGEQILVRLDVQVSDTLGNKYSTDSIILPTAGKNKLIFDITTNARWSASKKTGGGLDGWFSVPLKVIGGGDGQTSVNVLANATKRERKVYFYIASSDSSVVKKIVFVQPKP